MTVQRKMQSKETSRPRPETTNLVRRYGHIGIASLKAVLQYATPAKTPTHGVSRLDERFVEHTA